MILRNKKSKCPRKTQRAPINLPKHQRLKPEKDCGRKRFAPAERETTHFPLFYVIGWLKGRRLTVWARALGAVSLVPGWGHYRRGQSWPASNTRLCRVNRKQYLALGWDRWEGVSAGQKSHFVDSNFKRRLLSVWETPPALVKTLVWLFCLVCKQLGGGL